jgi:hypothetical protein
MKKLFTLVLLLTFSAIVTAQEKITEGIATTKMSYTSDDEALKMQMSMMGDIVSTIYFKDTKSRTEVSNPMSGDIIVITDSDKAVSLTLMDVPGLGKKFIEQKTEVDKEALKNIKVEEGTKTKTLLGYECQEKIMTMNQDGNEVKMILYVTDKIVPVTNQQAAQLGFKIEGFPMYTEIIASKDGKGITIVMEVTELKDEKVDDGKFSMTPPEGYTKMEGM